MGENISKIADSIKADFATLPESYRAELEPALARYITIGKEPQNLSPVKTIIWNAVRLAIAVKAQFKNKN